GIWRRRCLYRDPREDASLKRAAAVLHGRLRSAYLTVRIHSTSTTASPHQGAAARICHLALTSPSPETQSLPRPAPTSQHTLLYFDGGARGNPGPAGAGTVILQLGGASLQPAVLWLASVSYVSKTTNNVAEYRALLNGLRYAVRHSMVGLHIVGD
ncbi:hypothetical protein PHYSODRAFT_452388, partial [Phytophthora sojae]